MEGDETAVRNRRRFQQTQVLRLRREDAVGFHALVLSPGARAPSIQPEDLIPFSDGGHPRAHLVDFSRDDDAEHLSPRSPEADDQARQKIEGTSDDQPPYEAVAVVTAVARILIRTWPRVGSGVGISRSWRTSGGPYAVHWTAIISLLPEDHGSSSNAVHIWRDEAAAIPGAQRSAGAASRSSSPAARYQRRGYGRYGTRAAYSR